jgi:hypothetical protein
MAFAELKQYVCKLVLATVCDVGTGAVEGFEAGFPIFGGEAARESFGFSSRGDGHEGCDAWACS